MLLLLLFAATLVFLLLLFRLHFLPVLLDGQIVVFKGSLSAMCRLLKRGR